MSPRLSPLQPPHFFQFAVWGAVSSSENAWHDMHTEVRREKCFCLSIYNWSNLYKNLSDAIFCFSLLPSTSSCFPSILMCTWIWQCHVNLIKLNEWRRGRDEKLQKQAEKVFPFGRRNRTGKRSKQWNQVNEGQRKMKWKLISFKNKIKRETDFLPLPRLGWCKDWRWLWKILGISWLSSVCIVEQSRSSGRPGGKRQKGKFVRTRENHPYWSSVELSASLYRSLSFDWHVDWLIDSFRLEIAWWIDR